MHGCTEPSSTLHPYAFAIVAHDTTEAIGANANATIGRSASKYQIHGNRVCGLPFIIAIPNHRLQVNSRAEGSRRDRSLNAILGSALILSAGDRILRSRTFTSGQHQRSSLSGTKVVAAGCGDQHARSVRSPNMSATIS